MRGAEHNDRAGAPLARERARGTQSGSPEVNEVPVIDVAILKLIGFTAVGALVVAWLAVSFTEDARRRSLLARLGALLLYVALTCLFVHLVSENWEKGRIRARRDPFGFLLGVFIAGLLSVTVVKGARELAGTGPGVDSATHVVTRQVGG